VGVGVGVGVGVVVDVDVGLLDIAHVWRMWLLALFKYCNACTWACVPRWWHDWVNNSTNGAALTPK